MLRRAQKPSTRKVYEGLQKKNGKNSSLFSRIISARALNSFGVLVALVCVLALLTLALVTGPTVEASNPTSGTLTTTSAPVSWQGTAVGGGATGDPAGGSITSEEMCVEGVSCDTFTLTIAGTPADWVNANKLVHVHLGWTITGQDFDFYIHKGDLNGPVVASSGNGVTNGILLSEDADLDPAKSSVGTEFSRCTSSIGPRRRPSSIRPRPASKMFQRHRLRRQHQRQPTSPPALLVFTTTRRLRELPTTQVNLQSA